jgi:hypothetical protein
MNNITLTVYSLSQWTLLSRIAGLLQGDERFSVDLVYFGSNDSVSQRLSTDATKIGARYADFSKREVLASGHVALFAQRDADLDVLIPRSHPYRALLRSQKRAAHQILDEMQTDLLIVVEDGPGGNASLIAVAKLRGIPILVIPYGIGESKDYDVFLADKHREGNLNFLPSDPQGDFIRNQAPHWVRPTEYGEVLLFPADFVLARLAEGLDLPRPWAVQGGHADWIAVESTKMHEHYVREGIPEQKLIDLGTLYCDVVSNVLVARPECQEAFEAGDKIHAGHTSILIALPPSYHDTRGHLCEFATYQAMCFAVVGYCCGLPNTRVTVSVHPNTLPAHVESLRAAGAKISEEWIVELIPQHDIFLTDFSSTIRWAIAARKPTINYDIYQFRLNTYRDAATVFSSTSFEDICGGLKKLVSDDTEYRRRYAELKLISGSWGQLDGRSYDRLANFLHDLHKEKTPL